MIARENNLSSRKPLLTYMQSTNTNFIYRFEKKQIIDGA